MSQIYRGHKKAYTLTSNDVLWLARGFYGETGIDGSRKELAAFFWTWLARLLLMKTSIKTLADEVMWHSKALSPMWRTPGEGKCVQYPDDCQPNHIAHRAKSRSLTQAQLTKMGLYGIALEAQAGMLRQPFDEPTYDFAACSLVERQGRPCTGYNINKACFLPYKCLKGSEPQSVIDQHARIEGGIPISTLGIGGAIALVGLGIALYWVSRKLSE